MAAKDGKQEKSLFLKISFTSIIIIFFKLKQLKKQTIFTAMPGAKFLFGFYLLTLAPWGLIYSFYIGGHSARVVPAPREILLQLFLYVFDCN